MAKKPEPPKKTVDYQKHADECGLWARSAVNDRARETFAKMEEFWRQRVRGAGKIAATEPDRNTGNGADGPLVLSELLKHDRGTTR